MISRTLAKIIRKCHIWYSRHKGYRRPFYPWKCNAVDVSHRHRPIIVACSCGRIFWAHVTIPSLRLSKVKFNEALVRKIAMEYIRTIQIDSSSSSVRK